MYSPLLAAGHLVNYYKMITMNLQGSVQNLQLSPFSIENTPEDCLINVMLSKVETGLQVVFELDTQLSNLIIPDFDLLKIQRTDKIWQHTCFEIFLAQRSSPEYWEFNFSPSGNWNVYRFSGFRQGMRQETAFKSLPFKVQRLSEDILRLTVIIDLNLISVNSEIDVGISTVLERKDGVKSYWSLSHPREVPDFHASESWIRFVS